MWTSKDLALLEKCTDHGVLHLRADADGLLLLGGWLLLVVPLSAGLVPLPNVLEVDHGPFCRRHTQPTLRHALHCRVVPACNCQQILGVLQSIPLLEILFLLRLLHCGLFANTSSLPVPHKPQHLAQGCRASADLLQQYLHVAEIDPCVKRHVLVAQDPSQLRQALLDHLLVHAVLLLQVDQQVLESDPLVGPPIESSCRRLRPL
mmetsp:Transcript_39520/g.104281  ORF Transcript_39520/g.104281 Transcript_39520/m.104281 type:complete len:205 (-) Transcript_39520:23-637(-)